MKICVIGAGVIGLSTAYRLQTETTPKCRVTIISKEFSPHLTSDVAGGLIEMYDYYETDPKKARKWTKDTYNYALKLALSPEAKRSGASCCRLIHFGHEPNQTALLADDVLEYRPLTQDELARYEGAVSGFQYLTAVCEGRIYLPWLLERFFQSGGQIRRSEVHSLEQLYDEFDIVVNCTGLGARDLVGDNNVYPVKGQLLKVKAPWLFQTKVDERIKDQCSFIIPGFETVTLGGTFEVGVENKVIDPTVSQQIFSGCCKMEPSLVHAEVIGTVIGWRPARKGGVRLEKEQIKRKDGSNRLVVHNYGHGGIGVTLHWGCAGEVVHLINQELITSKL